MAIGNILSHFIYVFLAIGNIVVFLYSLPRLVYILCQKKSGNPGTKVINAILVQSNAALAISAW
jgi:hypothetical protein